MSCDFEPMGLGFGFENVEIEPKRKFRWLFKIYGVSAYGIDALPHRRGARPSLTWKEQEVQHLTETIHYPFKPEWKPVQLHLYDLRCNKNPVFDWIRLNDTKSRYGMYNPHTANGDVSWRPIIDAGFKRTAQLLILGGCGNTLENWIFEGCYPQNIEWGELDMDNNDLITVDLTIRYDRAYLNSTTPSPVSDARPFPTLGQFIPA